ncbi:hypothetical protein GQ600_23569 [Phytophthora cactorum]|nr:hypothetical protein GQ600_23569 [Phytophthora cactorum]
MLPHRVPVAAARRLGAPPRQKIMYYLLCFLGVVTVVQILRFLYGKCDTRVHMSSLLTKTSRILKRNNIEYWLDKGTLLGVHRDEGSSPGTYDREDDIPHKVKLTYDTENHEFYWSDPRLHDPCIRVYDTADIGTWVDIYWYVELTHEEVTADRENVLVPPGYDEEDSLVCCSEGLQAHTDTCAAEVAYREQPVPAEVAQFLSIQYGESALTSREIKSVLFMVHLALLNGVLVALVIYYRRRCSAGSSKRRKL